MKQSMVSAWDQWNQLTLVSFVDFEMTCFETHSIASLSTSLQLAFTDGIRSTHPWNLSDIGDNS